MPNEGFGQAGASGAPERGRFPHGCLTRCGPGPGPGVEYREGEDLSNVLEQLLLKDLYGTPPSAGKGGAGGVADSKEGTCYYYEEEEEDYEYYEDEEENWDIPNQECDAKADKDSGPGTFCGFKKSFLCKDSSLPPPPLGSLACQLVDLKLPQRQRVTAEEAERNAKELVAEEERVKKKAEKKRLKKKRQKDRRRQERREQDSKARPALEAIEPCLNGAAAAESVMTVPEKGPLESRPSRRNPGESPAAGRGDEGTEEEMEDELDLSSTFVSKAQRKLGVKLPLPPRKQKAPRGEEEPVGKPQREVPRLGQDVSGPDPSMVLAGYGNEAARQGRFQEAVLFFTEAVKLNPREHRLFGNRSYCYERMQQYGKALSDAHVALSLQPAWPKGFFRKGKALMGLKRYAEAKSTFLELLRLDSCHADAAAQLELCQMQLVLETGFNAEKSLSAGPPASTPELQPAGSSVPASRSNGYAKRDKGGERGFVTITNTRSRGKGSTQRPCRASSSESPAGNRHPGATAHPARAWFAVWVGNVTPRITQKVLRGCFELFGPIHSIRLLPEKHCAFVNYTRKEAAEAAYAALQGAEVEGTKLVLQLKHPAHATPPPGRGGPGSALQPGGR
ncbi:tetratricopeptide repeat protein 31 isoform X2 [Carettochelys insculpta]